MAHGLAALGLVLALAWRGDPRAATYVVERAVARSPASSMSFAPVAMLDASAESFTDHGAVPGRVYCYRVVARNAGGDSPRSAPGCGVAR